MCIRDRLAPASGFYSDPTCGRNEVRIAYVLCQQDLPVSYTHLDVYKRQLRQAARATFPRAIPFEEGKIVRGKVDKGL